jgi:predicted ABC-type ATPase
MLGIQLMGSKLVAESSLNCLLQPAANPIRPDKTLGRRILDYRRHQRRRQNDGARGLNDIIGAIDVLNPDRPVPCLHKELSGVTLEEANLAAVTGVEAIVASRIERRQSVGVETVLSSTKFEKYLIAAKQAEMTTAMIYVCLPSVELAIRRVADRVVMGGHDVSADKIRSRWPRSLDNAARFLKQNIDIGFVFSNGGIGAPLLIASYVNGKAATAPLKGIAPDFDRRME